MRHILLILSLFCTYPLFATSPTDYAAELMEEDADNDTMPVVLITDVMQHAVVHQDSAVTQLMIDKRLGMQRTQQETDGYRVQVYSSNRQQAAKNEALLLRQTLEPLLDVPVYALSEPPFWKVRVGNFRTREEATRYKEILLKDHPELQGSTYVVPDKIILIR